MSNPDRDALKDFFSVPSPIKWKQPRPRRAACDDCGRYRQVETTDLAPGVSADLCRECAATYTKES